MYNKILTGIAGVLLSMLPGMLSAQTTMQDILASVEANNLTLQAEAHDLSAKTLEARMGNSLEDLSVSHDYLWGNTRELGYAGEFNVSQSFDFPTTYAHRRRLAELQGKQYSAEYSALRQQILLETQEVVIEMNSLMRILEILDKRHEGSHKLVEFYRKGFAAGDLSVMEKRQVENEHLMLGEIATEIKLRLAELRSRLTTLNGGEPVEFGVLGLPIEELPPLTQTIRDYEQTDPALLAVVIEKEAATRDVAVSRSMNLPKFEVGYKHEYAPGNEKFSGVTFGLNIPIFSNRYNVQRAKAAEKAADLRVEAAAKESGTAIVELYEKAEVIRTSLLSFDEFEDPQHYSALLDEALLAGEISVVEYYTELNSLYDVIQLRIVFEAQYGLIAARINMIYL